jgi:hypothetical protein
MRFAIVPAVIAASLALTCGKEAAQPAMNDSRAQCSSELLQRCQRIERGEVPAQVLGTVRADEMLVQLRACTACGSFPRIESKVIPAAERLQKVLDDLRKKQP